MCTVLKTNPGKFEGQSCITQQAYDWMLDGMSSERGSTEEGTPDVFNGPFTLDDAAGMCRECVKDLLQADRLELYESNEGFVTVEIVG